MENRVFQSFDGCGVMCRCGVYQEVVIFAEGTSGSRLVVCNNTLVRMDASYTTRICQCRIYFEGNKRTNGISLRNNPGWLGLVILLHLRESCCGGKWVLMTRSMHARNGVSCSTRSGIVMWIVVECFPESLRSPLVTNC